MFSNVPMVDLGVSFGGELTIFGSVSRMEVREGTMKAPDSVVSQYRRFYANVSKYAHEISAATLASEANSHLHR